MNKTNFINIVEVGPRDGLQNEKAIVPTEVKLAFIQKLLEAGLKTIEATSFVSPKWVPQMADHKEIVKGLPKNASTHFPVLIPNEKGLDNALKTGAQSVAFFASASETFSQKNINCSISDSLQRFTQLTKIAKTHNLTVRGYVSCVLGCPYEGNVPLKQVVKVAETLFLAGCDEISLGDTIGVGTPQKAMEMVKAVSDVVPMQQLAIHFHDTYGQAIANIYACLTQGIKTIDAAVAGLGGCPYAKGATGNVATEDVLYLLQGLNVQTDIDMPKLIEAGQFICEHLKKPIGSKVAQAILGQQT